MAAISTPRGSCFPARPNLSSTCRPGSIPIPTRSRSFSPMFSRACLSPRRSPGSPRSRPKPMARRRRTMWSPRPARRFSWRKRPFCWPAAVPRCLRPLTPSMAAWRSLPAITWSRWPKSASSPTRALPSSSTPTIPMAGSSPRTRCSRSPIVCGGAADCCWSTRRSWMSAPTARASVNMSKRATLSCSARSASSMGCRACG